MVRFKFLTGDISWQDYGGKFISQRLNNSEFDYWLVLDFVNMHEATGDEDLDKYNITIMAVSPELNRQKADNLLSEYMPADLSITDEMRVEALASDGIAAFLRSFSGNNYHKLLREAKRECQIIPSFFGFYMDRPENAIGSTGWDWIRGDVLAGLNRLDL